MANETVLFKRGDSATITSTPVTDGQILFDTSGNGKMYLDNGTDRLEMGGAITVDASLSKTSTNAIQNKAVTGNILNSLAEVSAATQQNTIAGALALKEVNSSLGGLSFGVDENGNYGYIKEGADTVTPFSRGLNVEYEELSQNSFLFDDILKHGLETSSIYLKGSVNPSLNYDKDIVIKNLEKGYYYARIYGNNTNDKSVTITASLSETIFDDLEVTNEGADWSNSINLHCKFKVSDSSTFKIHYKGSVGGNNVTYYYDIIKIN